MDKENLFEPSNDMEEITEVVEETAEEVAEITEETGEPEEMEESVLYDDEAILDTPKKPLPRAAVVVISVVAVIAAIVAGLFVYSLTTNKYNNLGYLDVSGTTVGEVCEESEYDFDQFIADYSLPADMPKSTTMNAAFSMLPVKTYAAMYYTDFATIKEVFEIPDTIEKRPITIWEKIKAIFVKEQVEVIEETPWGFVMDNISLDKIYGVNFAEAKEHYGFGDDILPETLYGEVRKQIEKKDMEERIAADKEAELAEKETEGDIVEEDATEGSVEGEAEGATKDEAAAEETAE